MTKPLKTPLSPLTFKAAIELLGLRDEQFAYNLIVSEKSVMVWRKKSTPSPRATAYTQEWLDRVSNDITEIANRSVAKYEGGARYVVLATAWSSEGMEQLEPRYANYPARKITCRAEQIERQNATSRQRKPLPNFVLEK